MLSKINLLSELLSNNRLGSEIRELKANFYKSKRNHN